MRAGLPEPEQGEPFLPGPVFAAPFHLTGDPADSRAVYTRYGNPTWARYEEAVGGLEDAEAVLFSSGNGGGRRAAAHPAQARARSSRWTRAATGACARSPRRHLRAARRGAAARAARRAWPRRRAAPTCSGSRRPRIPTLEVYDIAALAGGEAITVVDNTTAGPLLQRPLDLGADYVLTSATKQMSGHADLLLGYVTTRDPERAQAAPRLAARRGRPARSVRDLARAPVAADARAPAGARLRQRAGDRAAARRPRRRARACATPACRPTPATRSPTGR